jgi:hypothetical protein
MTSQQFATAARSYVNDFLTGFDGAYRTTGRVVLKVEDDIFFAEVAISRDGEPAGSMDVWEVEPGKLYGEW